MIFYYNKILNFIEWWIFAIAVILPMIISMCKSAKKGYELNSLVNKVGDE